MSGDNWATIAAATLTPLLSALTGGAVWRWWKEILRRERERVRREILAEEAVKAVSKLTEENAKLTAENQRLWNLLDGLTQ